MIPKKRDRPTPKEVNLLKFLLAIHMINIKFLLLLPIIKTTAIFIELQGNSFKFFKIFIIKHETLIMAWLNLLYRAQGH